MPRLTGKYQIAAKIESVEGTAETLAATDAKILAYNPKCSPDPAFFDRVPSTSSFTKLGKVVGNRPMNLSFNIELRGSGVATTEPQWAKLLKACGLTAKTFNSINIGAITAGPFQHGETITGGTSTATGKVLINTANGAAAIYFIPLTGTFQSAEIITGGTSGATATTSSTLTALGKAFDPLSIYGTGGIDSLTIGGYEDGGRKLLKGARGNPQFNFKTGQPGMIDLNYSGVEEAIATIALLSGISHETIKPPAFLNAGFTIDAYAARIRELSFNMNNVLTPGEDANSTKGILSFIIADRNPEGSFKAEMVAAETHDFYGKLNSSAEMVLDFVLGSAVGNKFRFYAPKVQYTKIDDEDFNGIKGVNVSFAMNGSAEPGNDEFIILAI